MCIQPCAMHGGKLSYAEAALEASSKVLCKPALGYCSSMYLLSTINAQSRCLFVVGAVNAHCVLCCCYQVVTNPCGCVADAGGHRGYWVQQAGFAMPLYAIRKISQYHQIVYQIIISVIIFCLSNCLPMFCHNVIACNDDTMSNLQFTVACAPTAVLLFLQAHPEGSDGQSHRWRPS